MYPLKANTIYTEQELYDAILINPVIVAVSTPRKLELYSSGVITDAPNVSIDDVDHAG